MLVQDIEKTVGKSPEEEEDGDQAHGDDGLASGDLGSTSDQLVIDTFSVLFALVDSFNGRWTTLVVDIVKDGLGSLSEHLG